MKLCPSCGNQAADNAIFCDQCGTRLPEAAPVVEPSAFEPSIVEPVLEAPTGGIPEGIILCPSCGAENVPGEVFCDVCGEPLTAPEPVAAVAAVEEVIVEAVIEQVIEDLPTDVTLAEELVPEQVIEKVPAVGGIFCAVCGSPVNAGDTFCGSCGAALGDAAVEEEVIEEPLFEEPIIQEPIVDEVIEEVVIEEPIDESFVVEEIVEEVVIEEPVVEAVVEAAPGCPVCGASITPGQRFCGGCGATLAVPQAAVSATVESPAALESMAEVEPEMVVVSTGPYLEVVTSGAHIPLVLQPELLVGRLDEVSGIEPEVDMTPHGGLDGGISRRHAQLFYESGAWFVFDLDSTNGTCVDGQEIAPKTRVPIQDGAKIEFGEVEMIFHAG
ncbi:MAG: zinc ribbon domain-containing protein [Anaerolineae bacterium]|nr:zinc ribbon domain-containing protein [Anaerolineae bacterium]